MLERSGKQGWLGAIALLAVAGAPVQGSTAPSASAVSGEPVGIPSFACGAPRAHSDAPAGMTEREPGSVHLHALGRALEEGDFRGGHGVRVQCFGTPAERSYPVTWQLRLEQLERIETLSGEHSLTAFEERYAVHDPGDDRRVAGVLVAEVMTLPAARRWRVGADGTTLHARQDARRDGAPCANTVTGSCSVPVDLDWQLGGTEQRPELSLMRYVDGVASGAVVWHLQR